MKKIQVYGKEYPMRMTMGAMRRFKHETGTDVSQMGTDVDLMIIFLFCCVLQPYSKKALKVTDVCRFSWDVQEKLSLAVESTRDRFEELKKRVEG